MSNQKPPRKKRATIKNIERFVPLIKDSFSLCHFLGKTEKEVLVAQTIHACKLNYEQGRGCFSFLGDLHDGPHAENTQSYQQLKDDGLFIEGTYDGKPVIFPSLALILKLDAFFASRE